MSQFSAQLGRTLNFYNIVRRHNTPQLSSSYIPRDAYHSAVFATQRVCLSHASIVSKRQTYIKTFSTIW